jgi:hypothetical protein
MGESEFNVVLVEPWASVTISDLAFNRTNQLNAGYDIIVNEGKLTLTNITVSGNKTYDGGGVSPILVPIPPMAAVVRSSS